MPTVNWLWLEGQGGGDASMWWKQIVPFRFWEHSNLLSGIYLLYILANGEGEYRKCSLPKAPMRLLMARRLLQLCEPQKLLNGWNRVSKGRTQKDRADFGGFSSSGGNFKIC